MCYSFAPRRHTGCQKDWTSKGVQVKVFDLVRQYRGIDHGLPLGSAAYRLLLAAEAFANRSRDAGKRFDQR